MPDYLSKLCLCGCGEVACLFYDYAYGHKPKRIQEPCLCGCGEMPAWGQYKRGHNTRGQDIEERFWSYVDKDGPISESCPERGNCWIWTGGKLDRGYGAFQVTHHNQESSHRFSYMLTHRSIPKGLNVCHHCDVTSCVRPDHLWLGTDIENIHDRDKKGRTARGAKVNPPYMDRAIGSRNGNSVLTEDEVIEIRNIFMNTNETIPTYVEVSERYNVHPNTISGIVRKKTWKQLL